MNRHVRHLFVLDAVPDQPSPRVTVEPIDRSGRLLTVRNMHDRTPAAWRALAWADAPAGEAPVAPPGTIVHYTLEAHPAWDGPDLPDTWVKQVSFVCRREGLTSDEYRRHHREHVDVARIHHPGILRYQQDDLVAADGDGPDFDGISELWFASEEDLADRFYASEESVAAVRADTTEYIDFRRTFSVMTHGPAWT